MFLSKELMFGVLAITVSLALVIALLYLNIIRRKRAEHELRKYRDHLEDMVSARTAELEHANTQLQKILIAL